MRSGIGRSLVGIRGLRDGELEALLDLARALRARVRAGETLSELRGKTVALLFLEPSTRTRFSFEVAARRLGAECLVFSSDSSSTVKGETLLDTTRVLRSLGTDCIVVRHQASGVPHQLARRLELPLINAGDGINEHPTQALLDALTLQDRFGSLEGRTVAIVGDIRHSRVARSNCYALPRLGARVLVAGPGTLCPDELAALGVEVRHGIDEVLADADAVMMLRIQRERLGAGMVPSDAEYMRLYGLDAPRMSRLRPGAVVMHPAPMNRGVEIHDDVADSTASVIFRQAENGVFVRMAALLRAMQPGGLS
jgi:aspartate carbamoyltransferase catalytic subunit